MCHSFCSKNLIKLILYSLTGMFLRQFISDSIIFLLMCRCDNSSSSIKLSQLQINVLKIAITNDVSSKTFKRQCSIQ